MLQGQNSRSQNCSNPIYQTLQGNHIISFCSVNRWAFFLPKDSSDCQPLPSPASSPWTQPQSTMRQKGYEVVPSLPSGEVWTYFCYQAYIHYAWGEPIQPGHVTGLLPHFPPPGPPVLHAPLNHLLPVCSPLPTLSPEPGPGPYNLRCSQFLLLRCWCVLQLHWPMEAGCTWES